MGLFYPKPTINHNSLLGTLRSPKFPQRLRNQMTRVQVAAPPFTSCMVAGPGACYED